MRSRTRFIEIATVIPLIAGGVILAAPVSAFPSSCLPEDDPDCYVVKSVNRDVFPVTSGEAASVIAKAKEACEFMLADKGADDPQADYAEEFGSDPQVRRKAELFAFIAAMAYCPSIIGES